MKKIDFKHAAFHVLVAVYFLWLIVYAVLAFMALSNAYGAVNPALNDVFFLWLVLNLFMGSVLFMVIRLFKSKSLLNRVIFYTFIFMLGAAITTIFIVKGGV